MTPEESTPRQLLISYNEWEGMDSLPADDRALLQAAVVALDGAYSPYSKFCVGAAVRLADGSIVTGSNQENIAYPSGLCAERTALFAAAHRYPEQPFTALAIVGRNAEGQLVPATPCGACRQVMAEYEQRHRRSLHIILFISVDKILTLDGVDSLLPFSFSM